MGKTSIKWLIWNGCLIQLPSFLENENENDGDNNNKMTSQLKDNEWTKTVYLIDNNGASQFGSEWSVWPPSVESRR